MHIGYSATRRISLLDWLFVVLLGGAGLTPVFAQTFPPPIHSPAPGSTLTSSTVTFAGGHHTEDLQHWVKVGLTPGGTDFFDGEPFVHHNMRTDYPGGYTLTTVSGLPSSGTIYVKYYTWTAGNPQSFQLHSFNMSVGGPGGGRLDSTNGGANGCNSDRFTCIFQDTSFPAGAAVLDNETGLVWVRQPTTDNPTWANAILHCADLEVGGRKGWALPMREELMTLLEPTNSDPALPTDHPFQLPTPQSAIWSATGIAEDPTRVWSMTLGDGNLDSTLKFSNNLHAWCVRGGQAYDGQNVVEAP